MKPLLNQLRVNPCMVLQVRLPGGLLTENRLERSVRFHPLTGFIEQQLLYSSENRSNPSDYVTGVLHVAIDRVGERQPDIEDIASLCVADRQYLMIQLSRLLEGDQVWRNYKCKNCSLGFDIPIDRSVLPVKEASSTFPKAYVQLHGKELELQVPTGLSQKLISELDDEDAICVLVSNCLISVDGEPQKENFARELADEEIALIESALEQASPEVAVSVATACPECSQEQVVPFNPNSILEDGYSTLYHEIHSLALHYHWSEADILTLPRDRRQLYLGMVDRARGMQGATAP
jgi:hypothetical protein